MNPRETETPMDRLYFTVIACLLLLPWILVGLELVGYLGSRWRRKGRSA